MAPVAGRDGGADPAIAALLAGEPPRVWSLIVSAFGDLAQAEGARMSGRLLGALLAPAGIRPEAQRVALHRLRRDGWIASDRAGRESFYRLTATGRAESRAATPRIYGAGGEAGAPGGRWVLVALGSEQAAPGPGFRPVAPGLAFGPAAAVTPGCAVFRLQGAASPDWLRRRITGAELVVAAERLWAAIGAAETRVAAGAARPPLVAAAFRVALVHEWRRIALRLPDPALDPELEHPAVGALRQRVRETLAALPRPDLGDLEAQARGA